MNFELFATESDVNPIDMGYSSSHEDYDDKTVRGRRHLREDLVTSRKRHQSSMAISTPRIIFIKCKPLKASSNSRSTMIKQLSSWYEH